MGGVQEDPSQWISVQSVLRPLSKVGEKVDLVLRQPHRAVERLFVDYAGQKAPIVDRDTRISASISVAVMGANNYTYAEASARQDQVSSIGSRIRAFEYFVGCPAVVIPDSPKVGVIRPCWYEPDLNPFYEEMARHYGVKVMPVISGKAMNHLYYLDLTNKKNKLLTDGKSRNIYPLRSNSVSG